MHRRDLQERGETHLLQGGLAGGSFGSVQLKPRGQHPARDRLPRGGRNRREGLLLPHSSRRPPERILVPLVGFPRKTGVVSAALVALAVGGCGSSTPKVGDCIDAHEKVVD